MTTATAPIPPLVETGASVIRRPGFASRRAHPTFLAGAIMTSTIVALVLLSPVIGRYSPVALDTLHPLSGPSALHWLGTGELGRDTWSTRLVGGQDRPPSRRAGGLVPLLFGVFVGTVCGYVGGRLDTVVMRVVDVVLVFPFYVWIIALVFVVGGAPTASTSRSG